MRFAHPLFLLLGLYLPLLALRFFHPRWKPRPAALPFPALARVQRVIRRTGRPRAWIVPVLRLAALAALVLAAARPQLVGSEQRIEGEGIDILVALDISGSMRAADFRPKDRLEVAKEVIARFVAGRAGDRIGLVVFAGKSFTQCPLTVDHEFLKELLAQVDPSLIQHRNTAIGTGLANAVSRLRGSTAKSRVIVLLSDGQNNAGKIDPPTAAQMAKALGIRVYTIGVGRERFPLVLGRDVFGREGYFRSPEPMEPDQALLEQIASATGARSYRATDAGTLQAIFDEIDQLEKTRYEMRVFARYDELMHWPLLAAVVLLVAQLLLAHGRFQQLP